MATENFIITNGEKNIMYSAILPNIERQLFNQSNILLNRYADMIKYYYNPGPYKSTDNDCEVEFISAIYKKISNSSNHKNFGLDIPLFLERKQKSLVDTNLSNHVTCMCCKEVCKKDLYENVIGDSKCNFKRVMIIAQAPKRSQTPSNLLSLSSPFGIHCNDYRRCPQKGFLTCFINFLFMNPKVESVYITDAYKFYANGDLSYICTQTIGTNNAKQVFMNVLKDEISTIQPDIIITFGAEASDMVAKTYGLKGHGTFGKNGLETPIQQITINNKTVDVIFHKYPRAQGQTPICNRQIYNNILPYI